MPIFINQVNLKLEFYAEIAEILYYRYEFTVTYNPKYIEDIPYALSMTDYVIEDVQKYLNRNSPQVGYAYNYVVEFQKNGYPHIHGTMFSVSRLSPSSLGNFEKLLGRKYGKSAIYATGHIDKIHHNDHFQGTWQQYIEKEQTPLYFISQFNY